MVPESVTRYLGMIAAPEPLPLARLRTETAQLSQAHYQLDASCTALLRLLVELTGARRMLEVGTFTGYSALAAVLAMGDGGHVTTLDVSEAFTDIARRHWCEAGVAERIDLRLGPALDSLSHLRVEQRDGGCPAFDLALIDADKENYHRYYELCLDLVRPGGVLLLDNTLWRGRVADPSDHGEKTEAMRALNRHLQHDPRVTTVLLPLGDGLTVALKRAAVAD